MTEKTEDQELVVQGFNDCCAELTAVFVADLLGNYDEALIGIQAVRESLYVWETEMKRRARPKTQL